MFTGLKAYCKDRSDAKLVVFLQTEFVDDECKSLDGYKLIADRSAGDLAPYLL